LLARRLPSGRELVRMTETHHIGTCRTAHPGTLARRSA
jgi:hypothetical protein